MTVVRTKVYYFLYTYVELSDGASGAEVQDAEAVEGG